MPNDASMPRTGAVSCLGPQGFHRMAYTEWGPEDHPQVVLCVHGLTRNGRDFDILAQALAGRCRVICPDVVGRGRSDWLKDPAGYGYPQYLGDLTTLIARTGAAQVDWVGTSMGGLIGMLLAAQPGVPIRRLVMNDVGAFIPKAALERIGTYVGKDPVFADVDALEAYLRRVAAPFGPLTDAQWRHLAEHGGRVADDGTLRLAYDPGIAIAFSGGVTDVDLRAVWERVRCDVLITRGTDSDLLTRETAEAMLSRNGRTQLVDFDGIGHAPTFMSADQITAVSHFLFAD